MIEKLMKLGLTRNEATVYATLLNIGITGAGNIIKKSNLHRNIVYDSLDRLILKGLVSFVETNKSRKYEVTTSNELKDFLEVQKKEIKKKEEALKDVLHTLDAHKMTSLDDSEVRVYNGKRGLKNVFEDILKPRKEILLFASGWGMKKTMGYYFYKWHKQMKTSRISGRAIVSKAVTLKEKYPYKIRFLPNDYFSPATTIICEDLTINVIWQEEPTTIVIKNKDVAQSYRNYFEILWMQATD